jgi:outer membrane lipoprotein-sorting protein
MENMNRLLFILISISTVWVASAQQNSSATQIMERFRTGMKKSEAAEICFTFSGIDARGMGVGPFEGIVYRQGADYAMLNQEVEVYVAGNTKWIYTVGNNEATIMRHDPASVDLTENPLALFSAQLSKEYKLSDKPRFYVEKGIEITEITLTPMGKNIPYSSILLRINSQNLAPHSVKYNAKDGSWFQAVITKYTPQNQPYPSERFIFPAKDHAGVYVTDLR